MYSALAALGWSAGTWIETSSCPLLGAFEGCPSIVYSGANFGRGGPLVFCGPLWYSIYINLSGVTWIEYDFVLLVAESEFYLQ